MSTKGRISRFLVIALVTMIIGTRAIFLETATFAENRENDELTNSNILETAENQSYTKLDLDYLAKEYNVEEEYLYYILEIEKTFELEPYELLALIAQESKFIPQTIMDGGSLSYSTTQMKMPTAKTAYMAITEYYKKEVPYPTHELLAENKYYATMLAGGYLRYLHDTYKDRYESYTAYRWGIGGRLAFFKKNGHFQSPYALQVAELSSAFAQGRAKIDINN